MMIKKTILFTKIFIAAVAVMLMSCGRGKTGTLKLELEIASMNGLTDEQLKASLIKMALEFDDELELKDIAVSTKDKKLMLEIKNCSDNQEAISRFTKRLCLKNTGLQIYETYELSEIIASLMELDKFIKTVDSLAASVDKKVPETLEEKYTARQDSIHQQVQVYAPFKNLLRLNLASSHGYAGESIPNGAIIGYSYPKDTAELFSLFKQGFEKGLFPKGLLIGKGKKNNNTGLIEIFALKLSPPYYKPAMEGNMIVFAKKEKDENSGAYIISIQFADSYAEQWRKLTKEASRYGIKRSLALVYNNEILSVPAVYGEIPNGMAQISGNFTNEEIEELCTKMQAPYLPFDLRLQKSDFIPNN